MLKYLLVFIVTLFSLSAFASPPTCPALSTLYMTAPSAPTYTGCGYQGAMNPTCVCDKETISQSYKCINSSNQVTKSGMYYTFYYDVDAPPNQCTLPLSQF